MHSEFPWQGQFFLLNWKIKCKRQFRLLDGCKTHESKIFFPTEGGNLFSSMGWGWGPKDGFCFTGRQFWCGPTKKVSTQSMIQYLPCYTRNKIQRKTVNCCKFSNTWWCLHGEGTHASLRLPALIWKMTMIWKSV
jgi:hypothetical protein